jgi:hypothetical protein
MPTHKIDIKPAIIPIVEELIKPLQDSIKELEEKNAKLETEFHKFKKLFGEKFTIIKEIKPLKQK